LSRDSQRVRAICTDHACRDKAREKNGFDLTHSIHIAELDQLKPVEPGHRFEVTLESDTLTDEKYKLFENYQIHVHHDKPNEVSKPSFKRFLCSSPLKRTTVKRDNGSEQPMGSFHQCYRLDGRLIAMGVLDLLPHAVSGVYFIYHSEFEKWSFGKLSALREAALAVEKGYDYYYMGYYIHDCVKMRYKGDYKPQYVLDPMSNEWHPLEGKMRSLLDDHKFVSFQQESESDANLSSGTEENQQGDSMPAEDTERSDSSADSEVKFRGPDGDLWRYKSPADATKSGESLLAIRMPGVLTTQELEHQVNMDDLRVHLGAPVVYRTKVSV